MGCPCASAAQHRWVASRLSCDDEGHIPEVAGRTDRGCRDQHRRETPEPGLELDNTMRRDTGYPNGISALVSEEIHLPEQSVVRVYDTMAQAEGVVRKLDEAGFPIAHVSIVSKTLQRRKGLATSLSRI
jgi:hypothetical protein